MHTCRLWDKAPAAPSANRRRRGQRGFTLIELILAAGYFLIGISAVALFQIAAAKGSASAGDLMMATTLTANRLETMRNTAALPGSASQTAYYDRLGNTATTPGFFQVTSTFSVPTGATQYAAATVTTTWQQSPINPFLHTVIMQTYVGSN